MQPGFIPDKIQPSDAHYEQIFGAIKKFTGVIKNWEPFLPTWEGQGAFPFCVTYSRLNCAETVAKEKGLNINFSDRYLAVISNTTKEGNSINDVSEVFRNKGVVSEEDCSFTSPMLDYGMYMWDKVFSLPLGLSGKQKYFGGSHSWVWGLEAMKDALQYSPLQFGIGIGDTYLHDVVSPPSAISSWHAVECYYIDDKFFYIFDSLNQAFKKLTINYSVPYCKSFRDLPDNWKLLSLKNSMYILQRDPAGDKEVFGVKPGSVKRHIANRQTLLLGAQDPDKLWDYAPGDAIPDGDASFASLPEAAEIILAPHD